MGWHKSNDSISEAAISDLSLKAGGILADALKASNGGKVTDIIPVLKFMYNADVSTTIEEDVWSPGETLLRLASAEKLVVSSTDALDVIIRGIDNNYNPLTETVTLDGISDTTTTGEFLSVYSSQIAPDSPVVNAGDIDGTADTAGSLQFRIDAGNGQTEMCHFVVPAGYTGFLFSTLTICSRNDDAIVRFQVSEAGAAYITKFVIEVSDATPQVDFGDYPLALPEKSWIRVRSLGETNSTRISSNYRIILFDNAYLNSIG